MKITLLSDEAIRLEPVAGPLTIEAYSAEQQYSPFHMLASSLAVCTYNVLASWATHAKVGTDDLVIDVAWTFAEQPHRVGSLALTWRWPGLPEARAAVARRVAALCPIHATFSHAPTITIGAATEATAATGEPATPAAAGSGT